MRAPRLFVTAPLAVGATLSLDRAQAHHVGHVLRLRAGAAVDLFNGVDGEWRAVLTEPTRVEVQTRLRPQVEEGGPALLFAPIKRPRLDWLLEKAVELGVGHLLPVVTERTVVRPESSERLRRRLIEAAEQCGRLSVPPIAEPRPLLATVDVLAGAGRLAFADEGGDATPIGDLLRDEPVTGFLIGPEGGFAPSERAALRARDRIRPVSLGPLILRAETAALYALCAYTARAHRDAGGPARGGPLATP